MLDLNEDAHLTSSAEGRVCRPLSLAMINDRLTRQVAFFADIISIVKSFLGNLPKNQLQVLAAFYGAAIVKFFLDIKRNTARRNFGQSFCIIPFLF